MREKVLPMSAGKSKERPSETSYIKVMSKLLCAKGEELRI